MGWFISDWHDCGSRGRGGGQLEAALCIGPLNYAREPI